MKNIAILVDSGTDVPQEYIDKYGIYILPLVIQYSTGVYHDRVNITGQQVLENLETEIPKTSLPSVGEAMDLIQRIRDDGFQQVIAVTISSGLSGTHHMLKMVAAEFPDMDIRVIDTKNISIGAGIAAIRAGELIAQGKTLDEITEILDRLIPQTKVFFSLDTLKYLQKGGRIGRVTATMGTMLGIRPIISCNEEGIYYTVKKARGVKASMDCAIEQVLKAAEGYDHPRLFIAHVGAADRAQQMTEILKEHFGDNIIFSDVSSALMVHTGPGLVGVGIQCE